MGMFAATTFALVAIGLAAPSVTVDNSPWDPGPPGFVSLSLVVTIARNGDLKVDNIPIRRTMLVDVLRREAKRIKVSPSFPVTVIAARDVHYADIVAITAAIQSGGFPDVNYGPPD